MSWWQPDSVKALLRDLVIDELSRLRPTQAAWLLAFRTQPSEPKQGKQSGREPVPDFGIDSLERLQICNRIATFFQMREVGLEDNLLATHTLDDWTGIVVESLSRFDRAIGFRTSGSTGEGSTRVHPIDRLAREVSFWAELLARIGPNPGPIFSVVPRHHIYGFLFTVLLPTALGVAMVDARGWLPRRLAQTATPGSLIVGYPDFWRLFETEASPLPEPVWGISSTAPCPDSLALALVPARLQRLIQVYGATETGGIGWRDAPGADFALLPIWRRDGTDLVGQDAGGKPFAVTVPDLLDWRDTQHFRIRGRHDRAVSIGGVNVYPDRVARWLEQQSGVRQARVRPMRPDEGARLKAFIVPEPPEADPESLRARLTAAIERELQPMERPRALTFGPALPTGALGKAADWPLAD